MRANIIFKDREDFVLRAAPPAPHRCNAMGRMPPELVSILEDGVFQRSGVARRVVTIDDREDVFERKTMFA